MKKTDYDLVIIGGGPAGLTAGIYAARARLKVVLLEKMVTGGQILITDWLENYPGFPEGLSGADLADKLTVQAKKFGLEIKSCEVTSLDGSSDIKKIHTDNGVISTTSVIIATGASPKTLNVGEDAFMGKGVSYCATCDGPFFKDKVVVAVGGGDTAVQEAMFLTKFAKKVYLVHRRDKLRATKILQERAFANDKIEFVWDSIVTKLDGFFGMENVTVENLKTGNVQTISASGCFIWVGINPKTDFIDKDIKLNDNGYILVDAKMQTSIPGVFAVGDVRDTPLRQVVTAAGDAAIAAVSAEHYIESILH